jgi:hypothetical protein
MFVVIYKYGWCFPVNVYFLGIQTVSILVEL